ncbi:hypothetical protein [Chenggangzhangella methanolivorans]|jgi:hypothetical protein|uniref:Uncharacterized protein n=2 Tax=Hyphomicrobiales TaxID=356 RepID=A0A9E6RFI3_9HYPH|nr:hypothetical protein [Chenggangzhangella methanolivorans]PZQ12457.1 MAG: hypothetical protein DI565_16695 [Ancylobacter novellus]QZO00336.1 hypothetical protein K6K41_00640 [Chenggangzhangella methanolivorans]
MKPLVSAVAASFAALLSACSALPPSPVVGPDAADPSAPAPRNRYVSVTAGMANYRPVEPKPWLEQNKAVTSKPMEGM